MGFLLNPFRFATTAAAAGKAYFDGSGDYLNLSGESDFAFGTNDFCIEIIYSPLLNNTSQDIFGFGIGGIYPRLYRYSDNTLYYNVNGDKIHGTTTTTSGNTYHIAISRSAGVTRLFVNGVQTGSNYSDANNYLVALGFPRIGFFASTANYLNGYIFGIRFTKGVARYTASYTPPTSFTVDSANVVLCMNFAEAIGSTTFIDETGKTVTTNGNVVIVA